MVFVLEEGYCSISFSIYNLVDDVSIFVVSYSVPSIIILEFSNKLSSIRESVCSLTMIFPILEQSYILISIIVSLSSLTSWFSTNPFPYIFTSIWKSFCSLTIRFSILYIPCIFWVSFFISKSFPKKGMYSPHAYRVLPL